MDVKGNTVLITGGSNGIGLALAKRFSAAGSEVIICGRRKDKLEAAKKDCPALHIKCCDVGDKEQRKELFKWATATFPDINVLINNAGIQQRVNFCDANEPWDHYENEIEINLKAPIHFSMLFAPHLAKQKNAGIVNVSSSLSFMPPVWVPIYGATKAGIHSFTVSLRIQLKELGIDVVEIVPPAVNTDLGGVGLHTFGVPLDDFADTVFEGLKSGVFEVGYGTSLESQNLTRTQLEDRAQKVWESMKR